MIDRSPNAPKQIILLNGPPRSGKDTFAEILLKEITLNPYRNGDFAHYPGILIWGFSWHLKQMVHTIYLGEAGFHLPPNHFEDVKGQPQEILGGMSWRQAYIYHSEESIKPKHGKQWFGKMFLQRIEKSNASIIIVPDSGFYDETLPVIDKYEAKNCRAIQMHREGCDFSGDSRSYIDLTDLGVPPHLIHNNSTLENLSLTARNFITRWF